MSGSFISLQTMFLGSNPLGGKLPSWGDQGTGLKKLQKLDLSFCMITGMKPLFTLFNSEVHTVLCKTHAGMMRLVLDL